MSAAQLYPVALLAAGVTIAGLIVVIVRRRQVRLDEIPPVSAVLGVLGMVVYPAVLAGLAWSVGDALGAVAGWVVATIGTVAVAAPRLLRELEDRGTVRDQAAFARSTDPFRGPPSVPGPPPFAPPSGPPSGL